MILFCREKFRNPSEKEIADWYEEQEYQMNIEMASHFDMNGDPI